MGTDVLDILRVNVDVTVTVNGGTYRIEGLLIDELGNPVAWSISNPQTLVLGTGQVMVPELDGKMILRPASASSGHQDLQTRCSQDLSGNPELHNSPRASRSCHSLRLPIPAANSSPLARQRTSSRMTWKMAPDLWTWSLPLWSQNNNVWHSFSHAWLASATTPSNGTLAVASPLDLSDYAGPVLRFQNAYRMASANDTGRLEVSTDGTTWIPVATYTGSTPHWSTEAVDLSEYGEEPAVRLRFNAQAQSGVLWYLDDVYLNAWPAVKTAAFTYSPQTIVSGQSIAFSASYTSINTSLPITYTWDFDGVIQVTNSPTINHVFGNPGDLDVGLTVENPYDTAVTSQVVHVDPTANQLILTVNVTPGNGGTVTKNPDYSAYNPGQTVTLTPNPAPGFAFSSWSGACSGSGACVVTMDSHKTVTAAFTTMEYTLVLIHPAVGL